MDTSSLDKIHGGLVGLALGDALGCPHEGFSVPKDKYTYSGKLEFPIEIFNRFRKESKAYSPGTFSDDTMMTLYLASSIVTKRGYDTEDVIKNYMDFTKICPFLGRNTRELFYTVKTLKGYKAHWEKKFSDPVVAENAQSDGALMRCFPLFPFDDETIKKDVYLTNPSSVALDVELAYLHAIKCAVKGGTSHDCWKILSTEVKSPAAKEAIRQIVNNEVRDLTESKAWCLHGFYCSAKMCNSTITFEDTMKWIIESKGDTDTNACIVGGLIGTLLGYEKLISSPTTRENLTVLETTNQVDLKGCAVKLNLLMQGF